MEEIKNKKIGFCIYCGKRNSLSDEHIIPFGLSGNHTLSLASCEACRRITNSFEQPILRSLFRDYRFYKSHRSRTKHESFNPVREYLTKTNSGSLVKKNLHLNQTGLFLFLPEFELPKYLTGDISDGVRLKRIVIFSAKAKPSNRVPGLSEFKIKQNFPTGNFIRFLCKIGLGYIYLQGKEKAFNSFVNNLVLGKNGSEDWIYVGSPDKSKFKDDESGVKLFKQKNLLIAEIKLFDDILARYLIVLGRVQSP